MSGKMNQKIKGSVFTMLFSVRKYLREVEKKMGFMFDEEAALLDYEADIRDEVTEQVTQQVTEKGIRALVATVKKLSQ